MNHVRRAAYLNGNGATFLASGDIGKAFQSFKGSLQTLIQAAAELEVAAPAPATAGGDLRYLTPDGISRPIPRSRMDGKDAQISIDDGNAGKAYLYSKGLVFYPSITFTDVDIAFYASIVLFNLVLTHHRRSKDLQERDLTKLLALYDLVLRLVGKASQSEQYDLSQLALATLNNKSVVHADLGQHAAAARSLYHVWDVLQTPVRRPRMLEAYELEGLVLNVYLLLVNAPRLAGAA